MLLNLQAVALKVSAVTHSLQDGALMRPCAFLAFGVLDIEDDVVWANREGGISLAVHSVAP